jgi:hypothetical protein
MFNVLYNRCLKIFITVYNENINIFLQLIKHNTYICYTNTRRDVHSIPPRLVWRGRVFSEYSGDDHDIFEIFLKVSIHDQPIFFNLYSTIP